MADIKASFFDECEELLESYQDGLDDLNRGGGSIDTVNALFRAVHSIKGGAATFGFDALTDCAHALENALSSLREAQTLPPLDMVGELLRAGDRLAILVSAARDGRAIEAGLPPEDTAPIDVNPTGTDDKLASTAAMTLSPSRALWDAGDTFDTILKSLEDLGKAQVELDPASIADLGDYDPDHLNLSWRVRLSKNVQSAAIAAWAEKQPAHFGICLAIKESTGEAANPESDMQERQEGSAARSEPTLQKPTIRVELDRIDRLINLVGELVINQAMLSQAIETPNSPENQLYNNGLDDLLRLTRDLQDSVMQIRAQPVKPLFLRMARICRETADAVGKPVALHLDGVDTEIDKTVIERLADPLTHMIRNAVDHGIEPPDQRRAADKPDTGEIRLRAFHRSGQVIIELSDDGGGINRERVLSKARAQGIVADTAQISNSEIDALLFHPGLSTAEAVSDVSGRGVGMDVVRSAIHSLGGRLSVESHPGKGTRFSIALPLTLAVLESMIVGVQGQTMVFPLSAIQETLHIRQDDVLNMPCVDGARQTLLRYDDRVIPLTDLAHELKFSGRRDTVEGATTLIVTHEERATSAILIDEILEQRQVVIKGLQDGFSTHPCIAAATILGDGSIALIVDPYELIPGTSSGSTQATVPLANIG